MSEVPKSLVHYIPINSIVFIQFFVLIEMLATLFVISFILKMNKQAFLSCIKQVFKTISYYSTK